MINKFKESNKITILSNFFPYLQFMNYIILKFIF